jgi:Uracil DNA glycosylase superfamily
VPKGTFDRWVVSAYRGKVAAELLALPPEALWGVSPADGQRLDEAFGIRSIAALADNQFFRAASCIALAAADIGHDPGPDASWSALFAMAPLATYQRHPDDFRLDFGPVYYRGRLDGTARVLIVGQDPAANELVGHRAFVGRSGQRVQGFLRRLGIRRDYLMVNTFLYPVFGQFVGTLAALTQDPDILGFRNRVLDRIRETNPLQAIVAVGGAARDAVARWPGAAGLTVQHITHPSALDHAPLLANWNEGLAALRPIVEPEPTIARDETNYGTDWVDGDDEPIPRGDLPFGVPEWHGAGDHATRARKPDHSTDHKGIIWTAP